MTHDLIVPFSFRYRQLLKNRSLDPANQKKMSNLDAKFKYLEQQLQQVNEKLDLEWAEHLNKNKNKVCCISLKY